MFWLEITENQYGFYTKRVAVSPYVNLHLRPPPLLFPDNADESATDGFRSSLVVHIMLFQRSCVLGCFRGCLIKPDRG